MTRDLPNLTEISKFHSDLTSRCSARETASALEASAFSSVREVSNGLRKTGYIADSVAITTVFLADLLHRPVFSEGPAGSGKTQLAYAVAEEANTNVERLQCYEGIGEDKAIGKFDEPLQRLCVELKTKAPRVDWELLKSELHGEQFFCPGPLLRALQYENPCVSLMSLIDELDKVDHAFEAMQLELLRVWQLSIPKLGRTTYVLQAGVANDLGKPPRRGLSDENSDEFGASHSAMLPHLASSGTKRTTSSAHRKSYSRSPERHRLAPAPGLCQLREAARGGQLCDPWRPCGVQGRAL